MTVGDKVLFRGRYAKTFSVRGVIERRSLEAFGVRLENGNFKWASKERLKKQ